MQLSVIIPVYNNGRTIRRTLRSLANQTFRDFEVILIDSESTDDTAEKIRAFISEQDSPQPEFKLYTRPNEGISASRNMGLDLAKADVVTFCDGDDTVPREAYRHMYETWTLSPDCKLAAGQYDRIDGFSRFKNVRSVNMTGSPVIRTDDLNFMHGQTLWNKWFSTDIIRKHDIRFQPYLHMEDGVFLYTYLQYVDRIFTCPHIIYHYDKPLPIKARTASQQNRTENLKSAISAYHKIDELSSRFGAHYRSELLLRMINSVLLGDYYRRFFELNEETRRVAFRETTALMASLTAEQKEALMQHNPDLFTSGHLKSPEEIEQSPLITIVVSPRYTAENAQLLVKNLEGQSFPCYRVILPAGFRRLSQNANIRYTGDSNAHSAGADANSAASNAADRATHRRTSTRTEEADFFQQALDHAETPYIAFMDLPVVYDLRLLRTLINRLQEMENGDIIDLASARPVLLKGKSVQESDIVNVGYREEYFPLDAFFSNKVFRTEALLELDFRFTGNTAKDCCKAYDVMTSHRFRVHTMPTAVKEDTFVRCALDAEGKKGLPRHINLCCSRILHEQQRPMPKPEKPQSLPARIYRASSSFASRIIRRKQLSKE